jgi:hypothetical protein
VVEEVANKLYFLEANKESRNHFDERTLYSEQRQGCAVGKAGMCFERSKSKSKSSAFPLCF